MRAERVKINARLESSLARIASGSLSTRSRFNTWAESSVRLYYTAKREESNQEREREKRDINQQTLLAIVKLDIFMTGAAIITGRK